MDFRTSFLPLLFAIGLSAPAQATTFQDTYDLVDLVEATGTEVSLVVCKDKGISGYYESDPSQKLDRMTLCKNNIDFSDPAALWETVVHEATHVMQACTGTNALAQEWHPRMWRDLRSQTPHYSKILTTEYSSETSVNEAEAFWMELQEPSQVLDLFKRNCSSQLGK